MSVRTHFCVPRRHSCRRLAGKCARDITRSRTLFLYRFSSRLPHIYPQDRWLFLTWHLYGSFASGSIPASASPVCRAGFRLDGSLP